MTEEEIDAATVAVGVWPYDGCVDQPVRIVALPFDYWYALAEVDGLLELGEKPFPPGTDGLLYHVRFAQFAVPACATVGEAKALAESMVTAPIRWREDTGAERLGSDGDAGD